MKKCENCGGCSEGQTFCGPACDKEHNDEKQAEKWGYQILPEWTASLWNASECQVVPLAGGGFGALSHEIQMIVYTAKTEDEVKQWLGIPLFNDDEDWLNEWD